VLANAALLLWIKSAKTLRLITEVQQKGLNEQFSKWTEGGQKFAARRSIRHVFTLPLEKLLATDPAVSESDQFFSRADRRDVFVLSKLGFDREERAAVLHQHPYRSSVTTADAATVRGIVTPTPSLHADIARISAPAIWLLRM
jgi:hypothetical protein